MTSAHLRTITPELEMLGAERLVYARYGDQPLIVRIDEGDPVPAAGDTIHVTPRKDRVHWFDAESTRRIERQP